MRTDMYDVYTDKELDYYYPQPPYPKNTAIIGKWNYGDTIKIKFNLEDHSETPFIGKIVIIKIFNFRFENMYEEATPAVKSFTLVIDNDLSEEMFKKGLYYLGIYVREQNGDITTVMEPKNSCLQVV